MVDPSAAMALCEASGQHNATQALFNQINSQGTVRWSFQKRLEVDPSSAGSLIQMLIKQLEKTTYKTCLHRHVIPVLHMLYYLIIQSGDKIPACLYKTVNEGLMKLLTLPSPYSDMALGTLRSIKIEMTTPGCLYQRKIIAEQNFKTRGYSLLDKVFVLADPAVFSVPLQEMVKANLEESGSHRNPKNVEKTVLQHALQKGLGKTCQRRILAQALEALADDKVDECFQKVVLDMEESVKQGAAGHSSYLDKLQDVYRSIVAGPKEGTTTADPDPALPTALPFPEVDFMLWKSEEDLWNLLASFPRSHFSSSTEEQEGKRNPVPSVESGAGNHESTFSRRKAFRNMKPADKLSLVREKIGKFPGNFAVLKEDRERHTARVVVMGDDRVLGRLSKFYYNLHERESKCLHLTKKLNLLLYYIPISDPADSSRQDGQRLSLASLLGRLDPWYNSNINSVQADLSKQAGPTQQQSLFLLDATCYYLRCGTQPVHLPLYFVKMTRSSSGGTSQVEDVFVAHLEADISEFRHLKERSSKTDMFSRRKKAASTVFSAVLSVKYTKMSLSKREVVKGESSMAYGFVITPALAAEASGENNLTVSFDSMNPENNTKIQMQKITIKTMEHRTLSVCLDKDSRRTYTDVLRMEISPCLEPGCNISSKRSFGSERDLPLNKYLDKVLSLPINTFTGDGC
ncbi:phosphoinositide 3-kinase regulatory subunit 6 [Brachionichthys hirsutus]|uniref:phosphoinositide 3-kinase regulatory subunit 6 n=1 Tax=Brachionichthys hirsutus TaxID=412623 RepID=UPI003604BE23